MGNSAALAALVEIDALHGGGDLVFVQARRGALPAAPRMSRLAPRPWAAESISVRPGTSPFAAARLRGLHSGCRAAAKELRVSSVRPSRERVELRVSFQSLIQLRSRLPRPDCLKACRRARFGDRRVRASRSRSLSPGRDSPGTGFERDVRSRCSGHQHQCAARILDAGEVIEIGFLEEAVAQVVASCSDRPTGR